MIEARLAAYASASLFCSAVVFWPRLPDSAGMALGVFCSCGLMIIIAVLFSKRISQDFDLSPGYQKVVLPAMFIIAVTFLLRLFLSPNTIQIDGVLIKSHGSLTSAGFIRYVLDGSLLAVSVVVFNVVDMFASRGSKRDDSSGK